METSGQGIDLTRHTFYDSLEFEVEQGRGGSAHAQPALDADVIDQIGRAHV